MRVLVTGGAGFIGSHVTEGLRESGHEPSVFDDFSTGRKENLPKSGIPITRGDIRDPEAVVKAAAGMDAIVHLAALVSVPESIKDPRKCVAVNEEGTRNVLEGARQADVRGVILASSAAVYGNQKPPLTEDAPLRPLSPYGKSKVQNEKEARRYFKEYGLGTVSLRFFNVFGPRQAPDSPYSGVVSKFIEALSNGRKATVYGDGEQTRDFIYVKDVVAAVDLALGNRAAAGGVFNVGTGRPTSVNELLRAVGRAMGTRARAEHQPPRPGDIRHSYADIGRIWRLGFEPRYELEEGLKEMVGAGRI